MQPLPSPPLGTRSVAAAVKYALRKMRNQMAAEAKKRQKQAQLGGVPEGKAVHAQAAPEPPAKRARAA